MNNSTCPPHDLGFAIHSVYSRGGFPRNASLNVSGSAFTASTTARRSAGASLKVRFTQYPTALNKQLLSLAITRRTTYARSTPASPLELSAVDATACSSSFMLNASARASASSSSIEDSASYVELGAASCGSSSTAATATATAPRRT